MPPPLVNIRRSIASLKRDAEQCMRSSVRGWLRSSPYAAGYQPHAR